MTREQMFYERCQQLGATDTDIVKHALEDQARLRSEMVPLSLRAETAERALAQLREGLQAIGDGDSGCACTHDTPDCCAVVGEYCPHCMVAAMLAAGEGTTRD